MRPTNYAWHRAANKLNHIKCSSCGRFIGYTSDASCHYTPDSHYSSETIEWLCSKCNEKE